MNAKIIQKTSLDSVLKIHERQPYRLNNLQIWDALKRIPDLQIKKETYWEPSTGKTDITYNISDGTTKAKLAFRNAYDGEYWYFERVS